MNLALPGLGIGIATSIVRERLRPRAWLGLIALAGLAAMTAPGCEAGPFVAVGASGHHDSGSVLLVQAWLLTDLQFG